MPSAEQLRSRLLKKLSELFQLDQPDLDFGFYRIMHAKAQEVQDFIGTDLLKIVADAFGDVDEARKAELQAAYEKAIQTTKDFGAPNPEETEPVKKAKATLDAVKDTASAEARRVYERLGWNLTGVIPGYALNPDRTPCDTWAYWKALTAPAVT